MKFSDWLERGVQAAEAAGIPLIRHRFTRHDEEGQLCGLCMIAAAVWADGSDFDLYEDDPDWYQEYVINRVFEGKRTLPVPAQVREDAQLSSAMSLIWWSVGMFDNYEWSPAHVIDHLRAIGQ